MKKGFTLIELLAVIVILAIIALIATPLILNVIDDAKKGAFKNTAYGIIEAAELEYATDILNNEKEDTIYKYENSEQISPEDKSLGFKGAKPTTGEVRINKNGKIAIAIHNGKYCIERGYNDEELIMSEKPVEEYIILALPDNNSVCGEDFIDERDGQKYKTVRLGRQCWMGEELRYTGNGCLSKTWDSATPHNACVRATEVELQANESHREWLQNIVWYQFSVALNWDGVNPASPADLETDRQGICPDGWHIPNLDDFWESKNYVGAATSGILFKAKSPIWNGTDDYGLTALPTGQRGNTGALSYIGTRSIWWGNFYVDSLSWGHYFNTTFDELMYLGSSPSFGKVVRCVFSK